MKQMILEKTRKLLRFSVYMLLPILGGGLVGVSCTDTWDDHYESLGGGETGMHEGTIWQAIKNNPNLSNFAKVIEGCNYVDRLDGSQVFTVYVPTNDLFSESEADALIADYKAQAQTVLPENNTVVKEFIQNHMALYNHSFSNLRTDTMVLMNGKYAILGSDTTITTDLHSSDNKVKITKVNQLYSNGVMNILDNKVKFIPNVFEAFRKDSDFDSIRSFLYNDHFYYKVFQPNQSVAGSIVNGKTQYLDSVFTQRNELFSTVGLINSEDSTYMMIAPTNEVWKELLEEYQKYFEYSDAMDPEERDSLAYTFSRLAILNGTTFSATFNTDRSLQDSAMSINSTRNYTIRKALWGVPMEYYQYYMPKAAKGAYNQTDILKCSNGEVRKATEWNIDKRMTFHQFIQAAGASSLKKLSKTFDTSVQDSMNTIEVYSRSVDPNNKAYYNKLWFNSCLHFMPSVATVNHSITYTLGSVLSNIGYDIYAVVAPIMAVDTTATRLQRLPTKLRFTMFAPGLGSKGVALENANDPYYLSKNKSYQTVSDSVCYIKVADNFEFPKSTWGVGDEKLQAYLQVETNVMTMDTRKETHTREFCINCILVVPHGSLELTDALPATVGTGSKATKIPSYAQGTPGVLIYPHGKYDDRDYKAWYMQR